MKALLLITLLIGTLKAENPHWEVVSAKAKTSTSSDVEWTFTIRNISDQKLNVAEDWRIKGNASANLYNNAGMNLYSEPCHPPKIPLKVEPGATITVVILDQAGFDREKFTLAIIEGDKRAVIGTLSKITTKGQQDGADQSATAPAPESKAGGKEKLKPESEVPPR